MRRIQVEQMLLSFLNETTQSSARVMTRDKEFVDYNALYQCINGIIKRSLSKRLSVYFDVMNSRKEVYIIRL